MNNGAVRCGASVCRPVSAIYTKSQQTNGYVHVATIPAGAYNVTVTELQNSQNYLGECDFVLLYFKPDEQTATER